MGVEQQGIAGKTGSYEHSLEVWSAFNVPQLIFTRQGYGILDAQTNALIYATATANGGFYTFQDTSSTITGVATALGGALEFSTPATDNKEAARQAGSVQSMFSVSRATPKELAHEQCFTPEQITNTGMVIGLATYGAAVENLTVDTTGALADIDFIGFIGKTAATTLIFDFVYKKTGQLIQTIKASAFTAVANSVSRLGFHYDRLTKTLYGVANDVQIGSLSVGGVSSTLFPLDVLLSPIQGIKSHEAAAKKFLLHWNDTVQKR